MNTIYFSDICPENNNEQEILVEYTPVGELGYKKIKFTCSYQQNYGCHQSRCPVFRSAPSQP